MPLASSRATRQARYSASTARAAFGLPAASALDLRLRHRVGAEQRVGEHLAQPDLELPLLGAGERREIDPQRLGQLDQQAGGDGALVVLDQVQVARRDAEPGRQRLLRQLPLRCAAGGRCGRSGCGPFFTTFTESRGRLCASQRPDCTHLAASYRAELRSRNVNY